MLIINTLTPREVEIIQHVARGQLDKELAFELGITHGTARKHLQAVREKLNLRNRVEVTLYAIREGIVTVERAS